MSMDTRQLETLLAIERYGGFAAAAQAVNLTASAVSQQISALEAELGAELFDRSRRPPALTAKGAEVVRSARAILQIYTETKDSVPGGPVRGTLALGTLRTGGDSIVPRTVARMRELFPELAFRLRIGMAEELLSEVAAGQLDAALVADHVAVPPSLRWTEVLREPLVVLTPPGTSDLLLEDLVRNLPYIRYRTQVPLARQIDTEIARLGMEPRQYVSVNTMTAVIGCVQAGLGWAVIPYLTLHDRITASLTWFPFGTPPIQRRLGVVQRPGNSRTEVIASLIDAIAELGRPPDDND
ncbi:LysR family transcriptional regulator [Breoghania sp.]|uniref:LysR family transcriptional regulator n=1 Tax=Breoghania sp. TaxID=2065378 RepID=UPI002AAA8AA2|nr:LysR family transcriptional regulator [Breoghania sp.]